MLCNDYYAIIQYFFYISILRKQLFLEKLYWTKSNV